MPVFIVDDAKFEELAQIYLNFKRYLEHHKDKAKAKELLYFEVETDFKRIFLTLKTLGLLDYFEDVIKRLHQKE